jgi:hypothetical protein
MSETKEETVDEWADALEVWRKEYWSLFDKSSAAWRKRGEDEAKMRRLKKEYAAAVAAFEASDAEANEIRRQIDAHRAAGDKRGFRT